MSKKIIALVLAALVAVMGLALAGCSKNAADSDLAYVKEKGTLVVGITDFAPMDYQEKGSEEWIGFDADMAKAFAEHCAMKCYTDRMFHACDKIYSQHTTDIEEFKWVLEHNLDKGKKKFASVKDIMCQLGYEND